ncbi:MAG: hypothetical protein ABEI57_05190 [Halapricum sp.]
MATETQKLGVGAALLAVGSVVVLALGAGVDVPLVAGSASALGLAVGALLVGTSKGGRPV